MGRASTGGDKKGYNLTFSRKNLDVKKIISQKVDVEKMIFTDYICEAVRFYEKYKDKVNSINNELDLEKIKLLVDERIEQKLKEIDFSLIEKNKDNYESIMNKELEESFLADD